MASGSAWSWTASFADLVDHWPRTGNWTQQWMTMRNLAELLVLVEADELPS